MKRRWILNEPGRKENALALGVALGAAAGVAAVTFYLARLFISREEIQPLEVARREARGELEAAAKGRGVGRRAPGQALGRGETRDLEGERG